MSTFMSRATKAMAQNLKVNAFVRTLSCGDSPAPVDSHHTVYKCRSAAAFGVIIMLFALVEGRNDIIAVGVLARDAQISEVGAVILLVSGDVAAGHVDDVSDTKSSQTSGITGLYLVT